MGNDVLSERLGGLESSSPTIMVHYRDVEPDSLAKFFKSQPRLSLACVGLVAGLESTVQAAACTRYEGTGGVATTTTAGMAGFQSIKSKEP